MDVVPGGRSARLRVAQADDLETLRLSRWCEREVNAAWQRPSGGDARVLEVGRSLGAVDVIAALHSVRPLDASSIGRWRRNSEHCRYLLGVLAAHPALAGASRRAGYELEAELAQVPEPKV